LERITPARAGSSVLSSVCPPYRWDHPRARGEQDESAYVMATVGGSPPRARGAAHVLRCSGPVGGITPARAGSSCVRPFIQRDRWDHPRARGEQPGIKVMIVRRTGSPPRARGAAIPQSAYRPPPGITPARAGSSPGWHSAAAFRQDHPRARGEQVYPIAVYQYSGGSPPRARGAEKKRAAPWMYTRITPARAGSRDAEISHDFIARDHPRARGEQPDF